MRAALIWIAGFAAHGVAQFIAWSIADSHTDGRTLARVLMFPVFTLASPHAADRWFWPVFFVNSVIWASAATLIVNWFILRAQSWLGS